MSGVHCALATAINGDAPKNLREKVGYLSPSSLASLSLLRFFLSRTSSLARIFLSSSNLSNS
eukprot:348929-Amorphochlora_amoeboformis.AAC.1